MAKHLLEVKNLKVTFNFEKEVITAVDDVSFTVDKGETLALVGESGSGKSMTALAIMQLLPQNAQISKQSFIFLEGKDLLTYSEIKMRKVRGHRIAMIFQEASTALNPVMTIGSQIEEVLNCHFHHLTSSQKQERILKLLIEVGISSPEDYMDLYPHQLSGGLKQRAMIAMALAGEPSLLIADEPTTALDVTLQAQIISLLKDIQKKRGMALLFITHDLGIVYQIASNVAVIYKGRIVENVTVDKFFHNPQHAYSVKLFKSLPTLENMKPLVAQNSLAKRILQVNDLKVYYPIRKGVFKKTVGYVKAVDGLSFTINEGQTLALVGESGSGKTTTGMAVLRLAPITSGQIKFQNQDISKLPAAELRKDRKNFQVVFQDPYSSMNPRMLIQDIIAEGMIAQGMFTSVAQCNDRIENLLSYVGLDPAWKTRYPHEFSGGQRQRICIARALAVEPHLLICDEPTSALDVSAQMQVLQLLLRLQQELSLSYLLITHNLAVVAYMADEVAVMYKGKIVEMGTTRQVLNAPQHSYTQKLLSAVPVIPKLTQKKNNEDIKPIR